MLIFKEKLPIDTIDVRYVEMPYNTAEEARKAVLHVGFQHGEPCMWYDAIDYDCPCPRRKYLLLAIGTGQNWKDKLTQDMYIGTVLLHNDSLVLHYLLIECNTNQLL